MDRQPIRMENKHVTGVVAVVALVLLGGVSTWQGEGGATRASDRSAESAASAQLDSLIRAVAVTEAALRYPKKLPILPPEDIDTETLWLARCIYSESKLPEEQELIAWIIRNRVETGYRDKDTYRSVVLDPYQFSAFHPTHPKYRYYTSLHPTSTAPGWQHALSIAYYVRHADSTLRPFPVQTRHFYSERSMLNEAHPEWADGLQPVAPTRHQVDERRFRFFAGIM